MGAKEDFLKIQWRRGAITTADLDEMVAGGKKIGKLTKSERDTIAAVEKVKTA